MTGMCPCWPRAAAVPHPHHPVGKSPRTRPPLLRNGGRDLPSLGCISLSSVLPRSPPASPTVSSSRSPLRPTPPLSLYLFIHPLFAISRINMHAPTYPLNHSPSRPPYLHPLPRPSIPAGASHRPDGPKNSLSSVSTPPLLCLSLSPSLSRERPIVLTAAGTPEA